ncbi:MAG: hypothetical protein PHO80_05195 [Candidatus Gracilibacteria bacterium]|nr:hypothetical protein [Candidatus Gracilibacteria bacterium]
MKRCYPVPKYHSIFINNPFDKILNNHELLGQQKGNRSINITGDLRVIFKETSNGKYEFVEFINIGNHSDLYK